MMFKYEWHDKDLERKLKIKYPYVADLVEEGKLEDLSYFMARDLKQFVEMGNYIRLSEDLWDTKLIKAGDVGGKSFHFFTQNLNIGTRYFSNSLTLSHLITLPNTMLIYLFAYTLSDVIKAAKLLSSQWSNSLILLVLTKPTP